MSTEIIDTPSVLTDVATWLESPDGEDWSRTSHRCVHNGHALIDEYCIDRYQELVDEFEIPYLGIGVASDNTVDEAKELFDSPFRCEPRDFGVWNKSGFMCLCGCGKRFPSEVYRYEDEEWIH